MQESLFEAEALSTVQWEGCEFRLENAFLSATEADELLSFFVELSGWRQDEIRMYGKMIPLPRLHRWFADGQQGYRWSGLEMRAEPFPERLTSVRERIAARAGIRFNTALGNYYRDGRDSVAWHSDDEPELGSHPVIASLSLGAKRKFLLRKKQDHQEKLALELSHGSLLIMCGNTQRVSEHCLPKEKYAQARVNLTFRQIEVTKAG